ncbi:maleylacetate reductase [Pelagibacterium mangrovi]|uniref:maleylacetate reductase n=1 Tax=Pelagibacterium mangrovi TaxID=3119828 RepID=UPI002FC952C9
MLDFVYNAHPARVLFGSGTLTSLYEELETLRLRRVLVLSTPEQTEQAQTLAKKLRGRAAGIFSGARMHTPVDVTEQALAEVKRLEVDGLVAVGGGSTTGLAKALALRTDLPQIVAPTTYAGSEMTPILGETENGCKKTLTSATVLPEVVIYDVDLTLKLPVYLSVVSGLNAIAHAAEALYARNGNPIINLLAQDGMRAMAGALPRICDNPSDAKARSDALYGAWLCGVCLGNVGMALHHKLCHALGGRYDLPHAETHAVMLPHALSYNALAVPQAMDMMKEALGLADVPRGLFELSARIGAPQSLRELGMPESGIDIIAADALANPYWNPRPLERAALKAIIARAWAGSEPVSLT